MALPAQFAMAIVSICCFRASMPYPLRHPLFFQLRPSQKSPNMKCGIFLFDDLCTSNVHFPISALYFALLKPNFLTSLICIIG